MSNIFKYFENAHGTQYTEVYRDINTHPKVVEVNVSVLTKQGLLKIIVFKINFVLLLLLRFSIMIILKTLLVDSLDVTQYSDEHCRHTR